jgi:hypothetical protein
MHRPRDTGELPANRRSVLLSQSDEQGSAHSSGNVASIDSSGAQRILADLRMLRRKVIDAWMERAVTLTADEQRQLRDEIADTCSLLTTLTSQV